MTNESTDQKQALLNQLASDPETLKLLIDIAKAAQTAKNPPKMQLAPDGAPVSHAKLPVHVRDTVACTLKDNPDYRVVVAVDDFDPSRHVKIKDGVEPKPVVRKRRKVKKYGGQTKEELSLLSEDKLRELPEFQDIPEGTPLVTKQEIVSAILEVREGEKTPAQ